MQGTKTERYLFLFEKILLITKKRENSFSCKFAIKVRFDEKCCFLGNIIKV